MLTSNTIIAILKPPGTPHEVSITIAALCKLFPYEKRDDIVLALVKMAGIRVTNSYEGGIIVPKRCFE
jgi:hypothetical protein